MKTWKMCPRCGEYKLLEEFPRDPRGPKRRYGYCRPCKAAYMREWHAKRSNSHGVYNLRRYGIRSQAEYDTLLTQQGGGCAICGTRTPTGNHGRMVVDHDHKTGKVRGLLCGKCNTGLGVFGDNIRTMANAIAYMKERNNERFVS